MYKLRKNKTANLIIANQLCKNTRKKKTIKQIFGTAKAFHRFSVTNRMGKTRMGMKVGFPSMCPKLK